MFSADSALAILATCNSVELEDALRARPEIIIKLRNALDAFFPGPGIGTAAQSSTDAPQQPTAPSTTTFAQPRIVPGFGGAPIFMMAPGPPPQPTQAPAPQSTADDRPRIPVRGKDVPHSTPQPEQRPEPRPSTPRSPHAWHMDRAGHTWRGEAPHSSSHRWPGGTGTTSATHRHQSVVCAEARTHSTATACFAWQCSHRGLGHQPPSRRESVLYTARQAILHWQKRPNVMRHSMRRDTLPARPAQL